MTKVDHHWHIVDPTSTNKTVWYCTICKARTICITNPPTRATTWKYYDYLGKDLLEIPVCASFVDIWERKRNENEEEK